jgi:hypothetical protein
MISDHPESAASKTEYLQRVFHHGRGAEIALPTGARPSAGNVVVETFW